MFRQISIHNKLALALTGAALLAFAVAGAALVLFGNFTLEHRARQIMAPYAQLVSVGAEAAVAFEDSIRAREILHTLRVNPHILEAEIVLSNGRLLAGYGSGADATFRIHPLKADGVYLTDNAAELMQTLEAGAHLRMVMSLEELNRQTQIILLVFAAGEFVLLVATALGLRAVLQRAIVHPIAKLAETVEQVRTLADYQQRVPAVGADDVARLGQSFNAMMAAIQEREDELRRVTRFQFTILDNAAYGIISTTPEGIVTSFNPAAERLLGYTADEVVGKVTPACWHDPQEIGRRALQLSEELGVTVSPGFDVFTARARHNQPDENRWTFVRKDGTTVPVLLSVTALRGESGQITGFLGLTYDLTERQRAEEDIRQLNQELEQRVADRTAELQAANKELETFAYSVSHDLRAPLRHIDGFLGLLKSRLAAELDAESRRYMTNISASALRMATLIDDLLSFSRTGRDEMRKAQVDLGALVRDVIRETAPETPGRVIAWRIAQLPAVAADRAMLRVVLVNLISNALKFTRTRTQTEIEIGCLPDHETETVVFVRDNGVGFDMEYVDKLFGVFERLHRADEFEGTGIGLANVRRVIDRHGGRTWAEGKPDGGATFYFSLPHSLGE
ncbi:MAG: ATP-binding protein [Proteobacteria bacterium]|nr:ATP-binding protein [Pseudomonadota bacterium]